MNDATLTDRIHAFVHGTLPAQDVENLEREITASSEARTLLAEYREVHELTSVLAHDVSPSSLALRDVLPRSPAAPRGGAWVRVAAAVVLVGLTALAAWQFPWQSLSFGGPGEVKLTAIPLGDLVPPSEQRRIPASLQSFAPTTADGVRWLDSLQEAREIAKMVDRPVLLFVDFPGCPYCEWMDANTFPADAVRKRIGDFVPVRIGFVDFEALSPERRQEMFRSELDGWPIFSVMDTDGRTVATFAGRHDAEQFRARLDDALSGVENDPVPWPDARELTTQALSAESAYVGGRPEEAWERYSQLAAQPVPAFRELGLWGRGALERAARTRLDEARAAARPETAGTLLDEAVAEFTGTPLGEDLARIRDSLRERGAFPVLRSLR